MDKNSAIIIQVEGVTLLFGIKIERHIY